MGREILYCHRCGKQLLSEDFTRGRAMTLQNRCFCLSCLPQAKAAPAPVATQDPPARPGPASPRKPMPRAAESTPFRPSRGPLIGIGAAVVAIVLAVGWVLGSGDRTPPAAPAPDDRGPRSEAAALAAIRDAKEYSAKAGDNPAREVELWQKAAWASESLSCSGEAQKGLARAREKVRESWAREDREIETRFQSLLKIEQFVAAKALVEEALKRHDDPAWTAPMKRRLDAIQTQAVVLYPQLREKAAAAKSREDSSEVAELRKRIEGWGLPEYLKTFDEDLAKVPDPMRAGAAKGIVTVLVGKAVERTLEQVKADNCLYGAKQEVLATGETHVFLPYGKGDYYHESQGGYFIEAAPGSIAQFVSKDSASGVRLTYKVRFDQPISSFRLRCSNGEVAPAGSAVAGVEYSVDGKTWITAVEYQDKGSGGKLQLLGSLLDKFEATGLKTSFLYVRIYSRDRLTGGPAQITGCWLRLWTAGDPNWGDAHHTFFMHQVQLWVKPAARD